MPVVDDDTFIEGVRGEREVRRALIGLLHDDGWTWREMMQG